MRNITHMLSKTTLICCCHPRSYSQHQTRPPLLFPIYETPDIRRHSLCVSEYQPWSGKTFYLCTKKLYVFLRNTETRLTNSKQNKVVGTKATKISRRFLISRLVREIMLWRPWTSFTHGHLARQQANFQGSDGDFGKKACPLPQGFHFRVNVFGRSKSV